MGDYKLMDWACKRYLLFFLLLAGSNAFGQGLGAELSNAPGVITFNTRSGKVVLTSGDVTTALGFTPVAATSAAVIALWSGTCNASSVLGGDGACKTVSTNASTVGNLFGCSGTSPFTCTQQDTTPTTGVTKMVLADGAGQTTAVPLLELYNSALTHFVGLGSASGFTLNFIQDGTTVATLNNGGIFTTTAYAILGDTELSRLSPGFFQFGTNAANASGGFQATTRGTVAVLTANLKACSAAGGTPTGVNSYDAAVSDAIAPTLGAVVTGGGTVWAHVHCSLTTGTYLVDGV